MAKEFNGNDNLTFLRINRDGLLYRGVNQHEKSLSEQELKDKGFKPVKLKDDRVVYHKTFSSTEDGYLSYLAIKEKEFKDGKVKYLELIIQGQDASDMISFPLFKPNGTLSDYIKNLATLLPNLDFSKRINIVPSRKKNDRGYVEQNVFINYPDEQGDANFVKFAHLYGENGDIPPAEKVEGLDDKPKYDFTKQDTFLYKILKEQIERFKEFKGTNSTPEDTNTNSNSENQNGADEALNDDDHDDLPF
ncbi:MAG: hypothetical protein PQJ49_12455 [Sphaerochaetaceae bacterium]|nr:hypothetical protein [Sphaerochaetaceae bacterium]